MRPRDLPVRRLRHWKQQFDPRARFVWRKGLTYAGQRVEAGDVVPDGLLKPTKLRRFWESGVIELAEFEAPDVATGRPRGPVVTHTGGGWYDVLLPGREEPVRVKGRAAAEEVVEEARTQADGGKD